MTRGKLKYKDVVGRKGQKGKKKLPKKAPKQRKTYSLYPQNKPNNKRKFARPHDEFEKRQRVEEPLVEHEEEQESEENDSDEDQMKQLLSTFTSREQKKQLEAIESDSSSSEDEDIDVDEIIEERENEGEVEDDLEVDVEINEEEISGEKSDDDFDIELTDHNDDNIHDPFNKHICYDLHDEFVDRLQNTPLAIESSTLEWPCLGKLLIQIPKFEVVSIKSNPIGIQEEKKFATPGVSPSRLLQIDFSFLGNVHVKPQIINNLPQDITFSALQCELFSIINNYQDLYYTQRTFKNGEDIRFVYCLHVVNHILKTRLKVVHHNVRLTKKDDVPEDFRDQGLVRPKVLIVVPFKDAAYKIIQLLIKILIPINKGYVMNRKRFVDEYTGNEIAMPKKNPKPEDYEQTFTGNSSDDFRIGLTVTKKSLKLFADFYSSDIIIASPLGLRTVIGAEGEAERDFDFLASIELLVLDQTDLFLMQNWDHLNHIFNHLHLQPKQSHGTDFSRVRTWSLNGWAKYYRQTLIFSSVSLPEINSIFNKKCINYAGKVKIVNEVEYGSIAQVIVQIPHVFQKFEASSAQQAIETRFEFFINKILPKQRETFMKQTLIYAANYFDFVRLRNYFKREDISFVQICEYSKEAKVARARDIFFHGDKHFLLYTERHHFFNRIRIKGIRHVVFFQPPNFPHFYYEICNLMQESNMNKKVGNSSNMTVTVLYSKYDIHQLSAIVGTTRALKMLQSDRNVHMMVTGSE